jgi:protein-disulfide isomerase
MARAQLEELAARIPPPQPGSVVPTPAAFEPERMTTWGDPDAPITLVEFSDYQCPFCLTYAQETFPSIIQRFVETGQVRYIWKDYPLVQLHPEAYVAAQAARCAGEQQAYWEMHELLFKNQEAWSGQTDLVTVFVALAAPLELDRAALQTCLEDGRYEQAVLDNLDEGQRLGVSGTPTFFVNGYPIVGARSYELFELALALAAVGRISDAFAQAPAPTPMAPDRIPVGNSPVLGSPEAPVVMIEYSDYQCPYCGRYSVQTFPQIRANYVDTGKVRYVFKDFPLGFHAQAEPAAQAARCAGDQGDYWGMHELLFAHQSEWSTGSAVAIFEGYAQRLGLDTALFNNCLETQVHAAAVKADLNEGLSVGVTGTPAFFVGGSFISGAQPYAVYEQAIEQALGQ